MLIPIAGILAYDVFDSCAKGIEEAGSNRNIELSMMRA
jgi:hypothetical protein